MYCRWAWCQPVVRVAQVPIPVLQLGAATPLWKCSTHHWVRWSESRLREREREREYVWAWGRRQYWVLYKCMSCTVHSWHCWDSLAVLFIYPNYTSQTSRGCIWIVNTKPPTIHMHPKPLSLSLSLSPELSLAYLVISKATVLMLSDKCWPKHSRVQTTRCVRDFLRFLHT